MFGDVSRPTRSDRAAMHEITRQSQCQRPGKPASCPVNIFQMPGEHILSVMLGYVTPFEPGVSGDRWCVVDLGSLLWDTETEAALRCHRRRKCRPNKQQ